MPSEMPGLKQRGTILSGCTDWLRPVIFKVERLDVERPLNTNGERNDR